VRRTFSAVSANTHHSARVAANLFGIPEERIAVIYNGLDFELLRPTRPAADVREELGLDDEVVIVGTASNLHPHKRVHLLLDALAQSERHDLRLLIVGDGPTRGDLEQRALTLGLDCKVTFTGTRSDMGNYLQVMDVFVLPTGPREAFGNAAVEAMAAALPVIVFADGGGLLEHVTHGETGLIVPDVSSLTRAVDALAENEPRRAALGQAGQRSVRDRYTLEAMASGYASLYASACGG
jgi:glycosyltransferase involved in cell wall biosynthesis